MSQLSDEQMELAKQVMANYDKDNDGNIDKTELRYALLEMRDMLKERFGVLLLDEDIEKTINKTDSNQDGQISIEEFINSDFFYVYENVPA
jgi:Ca2+-binding EF-hand superfamily protein